MKENYTHIEFILDESGSMWKRKQDVIGGFNSFIEEQYALPGELSVNLTRFSSIVSIPTKVERGFKLSEKIYSPGGNTALLDAVGLRIDNLGRHLRDIPEDKRPEKVIFVIITDGEENSSKFYTKTQVKQSVEHQRDGYNWQFVFLGADIDAFRDGTQLGFSAGSTMSFDSSNYYNTYTITGQGITDYRTGITSSVNLSDR